MCPIDTHTNDFPREYNGQYTDIDIYIKCYYDCKIFHYGRGILEFYCPTKRRGLNIIESMKRDKVFDHITNVEITDEEVMLQFKDKSLETLSSYFKIVTNGAQISPYSSKNLPKTAYSIPDEDLDKYKTCLLSLDNNYLKIGYLTTNFINSLETKKNTKEMIKQEMRLLGLKGKEYIHKIGQWDKFIRFLETEIGT